MDVAAVVPILVVAVTAIAGLIAYTYQKWLDRKNALVDLRRTAYQEVLVSLQRHLHVASADTLVELSAARARAFVVASDRVATAMGEFFRLAVNSASVPDGNQVMAAYANMTIEMRRDCFERTQLAPSAVANISPVVWARDE